MSLNQLPSIDIDRNAHPFARFRRAAIYDLGAMNEDIAAFLGVDDPKLAHFCPITSRNMEHSMIADLSAHFGIKGRLIENDGELFRLVSRQNILNNRLSFQKIVAKKFCWHGRDFSFNCDLLFLLSLARARALLLHQLFKAGDIDCQSSLTRHQLS